MNLKEAIAVALPEAKRLGVVYAIYQNPNGYHAFSARDIVGWVTREGKVGMRQHKRPVEWPEGMPDTGGRIGIAASRDYINPNYVHPNRERK